MTDSVFIPIKPRSKQPLVKEWSSPEPPIADWWTNVPEDVNKAIRCDGIFVVDCDGPDAEHSFVQRFPKDTEYTYSVRTPRGAHYYFLLPAGVEFQKQIAIEPNIDLQTGSGAYVLVPPSVNADGVPYKKRSTTDIVREPSPELLAWVAEHQSHKKDTLDTKAEPGDTFSMIPAGARNDTLTKFAGLMRRLGFDDDGVGRVLLGLNHQLTDEPLPDAEVAQIVLSSSRWESEFNQDIELELDNDELFTWLHDMTIPPPPEWLWAPYLPQGRLVLLDGSEGIGKGLFAVNAAVNVTQGLWCPPANVLWMTAEDDPEEDIQRRMHAAGWKPGQGTVGFFNESPSFPKHAEVMMKLIHDTDAKLVVLDPGRSFLGAPDGVDFSFNNEAAIRPGMEALNKVARQTGATLLFVHHWNKNTQATVQYRSGGSGAFAQVVRHRVTMAWAGTTEDGQGAFEVTKSNIAPKGGLREYVIEPHESLSTALLRPSGLIQGHSDLNGWLKAAEAALASGEVIMDPADSIATWAERNLLPGAQFPDWHELVDLAQVRQRDVKPALLELEESGRLERGGRNGLARVWRG